MAIFKRTCRECGTGFEARHTGALFCGDPCRIGFNRRRRDRGAELYDAIMSGVPDAVEKLKAAYRQADEARRAGRPSHQPWNIAKLKLPVAYGAEGDGR